MTWFVASFINVIEQLEGIQTEFPVEEEFYLFEAHSQEELDSKIKERIKIINSAGEEGMTYYGQKAKESCLGVRKIKSICNTANNLDIDEDPPSDDSQIGYNYMTVKSLEEAKLLAEGKAAHVHYIDEDPMED